MSVYTVRALQTGKGEQCIVVGFINCGDDSWGHRASNEEELKVVVCWQDTQGSCSDLDACGLLLTSDGKVRDSKDYVCCDNKTSPDAVVEYLAEGIGFDTADDIQAAAIRVNLSALASETQKIVFALTVTISNSTAQNVEQDELRISKALVCVVDNHSNKVLAAFELSEDAFAHKAFVFGELYRANDDCDWIFRAVDDVFYADLATMLSSFGIQPRSLEPVPDAVVSATKETETMEDSHKDDLESVLSKFISKASDRGSTVVDDGYKAISAVTLAKDSSTSTSSQASLPRIKEDQPSRQADAVSSDASVPTVGPQNLSFGFTLESSVEPEDKSSSESLDAVLSTFAEKISSTQAQEQSHPQPQSQEALQASPETNTSSADTDVGAIRTLLPPKPIGFLGKLGVFCASIYFVLQTGMAIVINDRDGLVAEDVQEPKTLQADLSGVSRVKLGVGLDPTYWGSGNFVDVVVSSVMIDADLEPLPDYVANRAIVDSLDSIDASGTGDDDYVIIDLNRVPSIAERVALHAFIFQEDRSQQNFGQVKSAYIRLVNEDNGLEIARFNLTKDASSGSSVFFGDLRRMNDGSWLFKSDCSSW